MAKILKPYEVPLDMGLAREILNIPVETEGDMAPMTVGERVQSAIKTVDEANAFLSKSSLANLVADTLMRRLKKRGTPCIRVRPDGVVVLHVAYDELAKPQADPPVKQKRRKSHLPTLDAMRNEAAELGIDIEPLGRKRKTIHALIERTKREKAADDAGSEVKPPARMVDEVTESGHPADLPKTVLRKKVEGGPIPEGDDLNMGDLLNESA